MAQSTYPVWGWGRQASDEPTAGDVAALAPLASGMLGHTIEAPLQAAPLPELPADRVSGLLPAELAAIASRDPLDRARHSVGRSYRDVVRAIAGRVDHAVDAVLRPTTEPQIAAALDWAADHAVAVIPYGGGTSVVGGVEPAVGDAWSGCVSLDLSALSGLTEVDPVSRSVRALAGTAGPDLEAALRPGMRVAPDRSDGEQVGMSDRSQDSIVAVEIGRAHA